MYSLTTIAARRRLTTLCVVCGLACGGDGDGETVSEAPPNVEQQLQVLAAELTEIRCEIKAMETPGSDVDTEKREELQSQSKKVVKKALGVLNGNRLQGPEINRLRMQYLDPALNTTDC